MHVLESWPAELEYDPSLQVLQIEVAAISQQKDDHLISWTVSSLSHSNKVDTL